jgi:hypothetical protein
MSLEQDELRMAVSKFLAAKRALRRAYRKAGAIHGRVAARPMLEWLASDAAWNEPRKSMELAELTDQNQKLKRSLALLHAYSLDVHGQRNRLVMHRTALLVVCEDVVSWMRQHCRTDERAKPLLDQLDHAIVDIKASTMECRHSTLAVAVSASVLN